jgi:dihydrofolate reductase
MSLDAFIAGPHGEADWIPRDPEIDFKSLFESFDTFLVGRITYEAMAGVGRGSIPGAQVIVFSHTLRQADHPGVTITAESPEDVVARLRTQPGKDIWLFGGGALFRSFLERQLVDTVEVATVPVLLGQGIPLLPSPAPRVALRLTGHRLYQTSGIMKLEYEVKYKRTRSKK